MRRIAAMALVLCSTCTWGQGAWNLGVRGSWGYLSPHHVSMWYLVEKHALMAEVFYERPFSGARPWHAHYGHPSWGIGLMATDAGSPSMLGSVTRLLPYLDLPLLQGSPTTLHARIGWGLGWVMDPYDRRDNHQQIAIGSRVNAAVILALEAERTFGRTTLGLGIALDHQSNGSLQVPNLGINLLTASLSVRRWSGTPSARKVPFDSLVPFIPAWGTEVMLAWGLQEVVPVGTGKHNVIVGSGTIYRHATPKSSFGAGLDVFNKASIAIRDPELADQGRMSFTQIGLHLGYALRFGGMSILVDQGVYLLSPIDEKTSLYQRIGMRQRFGRRFFANVTLKTHFGAADHFELGLGYHW